MSSIVYYVFNKLCKTIKSLYFKSVKVVGEENIPSDGPVILCGNHYNMFIDPVMIGSIVNRHVSYVMAAISFKVPFVGQFAKLMKAIPVKRPQDFKILGSGKGMIIDKNTIIGVDTKFLEETKGLEEGWSLYINKKTVHVTEVIDNNKIIVKDIIGYSSFGEEQHQYYFIPKLDNSLLFEEAYQQIKNNGCICIFPEGESHCKLDIIRLKAGIAFMALGAMSKYKCKNVKIVPVGLNYFNREKFRSEVIVEFGKAFEVPQEWAIEFENNKREVTEKLLNEIEQRMKAVTLTFENYEDFRTMLLFRKMYVPKGVRLSPTQYSELCKRFAAGYKKLKDIPESKKLKEKSDEYKNQLLDLALDDKEVRDTSYEGNKMLRRFFFNLFVFLLILIFLSPGIMIFAPFFYYIRKFAEKKRIADFKADPSAQGQCIDGVSSYRLIKFFSILPLMYIAWLFLFLLINPYYSLILDNLYVTGFFTKLIFATILFPMYFYACVRGYDIMIFFLKTFYSRCVLFAFPNKLKRLRTQRQELLVELKQMINEHMKDVNPEYEYNRIIKDPSYIPDVEKDDLKYLEQRFDNRKTTTDMAIELELLEKNN